MRQEIIRLAETQQRERQIDEVQARFTQALEHVQGLLEPELAGWTPTGARDLRDEYGEYDRERIVTDLATLRTQSQKAYYLDPHGRGVIRTNVKFIIGGGTIVDFHEKHEDGLEALNVWWKKFRKKNKWHSFSREYVTRAFRDGEVFVRKFSQPDGPPIFRFVDPDRIGTSGFPDGIETEKEDVERILRYHISRNMIDGQLGDETVDAADMHHFKLDVDRNVKRGHPILSSVLTTLAEFKHWKKARMVLNLIRTSLALVKEVQGSPNDISRLRATQKTTRNTTDTNRTRMLQPGTIITASPGVKYTMLSPNLDAKDAAEDGNTLLRSVAAGAGFPDVFVTANYSDSNFASTVVSQNTGIREWEDWEGVLAEHMTDLVMWVLEEGLSQGEIPETVVDDKTKRNRPIDLDFDIVFPPLIRRDVAQENNAYFQMYENRVISKRTWGLKMGLNPDMERKFLREEAEDEAENPLPLPPAPPNGGNGTRRPTPKRVEDRAPRQNVQV
mgnify:FL=1